MQDSIWSRIIADLILSSTCDFYTFFFHNDITRLSIQPFLLCSHTYHQGVILCKLPATLPSTASLKIMKKGGLVPSAATLTHSVYRLSSLVLVVQTPSSHLVCKQCNCTACWSTQLFQPGFNMLRWTELSYFSSPIAFLFWMYLVNFSCTLHVPGFIRFLDNFQFLRNGSYYRPSIDVIILMVKKITFLIPFLLRTLSYVDAIELTVIVPLFRVLFSFELWGTGVGHIW